MHMIKTWCENTAEGKSYLQYNGYEKPHRLLGSAYFVCSTLGATATDIDVIF